MSLVLLYLVSYTLQIFPETWRHVIIITVWHRMILLAQASLGFLRCILTLLPFKVSCYSLGCNIVLNQHFYKAWKRYHLLLRKFPSFLKMLIILQTDQFAFVSRHLLSQIPLVTFPHLSTHPGLYLECVWSCLNFHPLNSDVFWAAKSIAFILIDCLWIGNQSFCNDYDIWLLERYFFMALKEVSSGNSRDVDWHSSHLLLIFLSIFFPILIAVGTDFTVSHHSRPLDIASNLLLLLFISSFNTPDLISILKHPVKKQTRMYHKETP